MKILINTILILVVLLASACKEECETIVRYKDPSQINIKLGESTNSFSNFELTLKSINIKKNPPADTTISKDSTKEAISCVMMVMRPDSSDRSEFVIYPGNFTLYGNSKVEEGKPFLHFKIMCNKLNVDPESVDLTIWNGTFMQDCNPW